MEFAISLKERLQQIIETLPDDASVDDVVERLYFISQVEEGFAELDRGEGVSHEEARKRFKKWLE